MSWVAKTLHVSPTGRAKPHGKTTRKSHSVRGIKYAKGPGHDRPLPLHKQCHPQPLTRTSLNPGCYANAGQYHLHQFAGLGLECIMEGVGLSYYQPGYWSVCLPGGTVLGYADCHTALAYRNHAKRVGVTLEVFDHDVEC